MNNETQLRLLMLLIAGIAILLGGCAPLDNTRPAVFGKLFVSAKDQAESAEKESAEPTETASGMESSKSVQKTQVRKNPSSKTPDSRDYRDINNQQTDESNSANQPTTGAGVSPVPPLNRDQQIQQQAAYEQGIYDTIQASYQQPARSRSFSNQPPRSQMRPPPFQDPNYQNNGFQGQPFHRPPTQLPYVPQQMVQPSYGGQPTQDHQQLPPPAYRPQAPTDDLNTANSLALNGPDENFTPTSQDGYLPNSPPWQNVPFDNTLRAPGSGHFSGGQSMVGSELRRSTMTATEVALEQQQMIHQLRGQLKMKNNKLEQFASQMKIKDKTIGDTQKLLSKSRRLSDLLREKIAELNVKVEDLNQEKIVIEKNADRALKEIESALDSVLINSISKK